MRAFALLNKSGDDSLDGGRGGERRERSKAKHRSYSKRARNQFCTFSRLFQVEVTPPK